MLPPFPVRTRPQSAHWLLATLLSLACSAAHAQHFRLPSARPQWQALPAIEEEHEELPAIDPRSGPASGLDEYEWSPQLMPRGLIFTSYLAGEKEPRFRSLFSHDKHQGWIWDITLGGRVGLFRYGTQGISDRPEGFQIDVEGAGIPRLDLEHERDLISADFRAGLPITWGNRYYQTKLAYYHLSSHLGDEFLIRYPDYDRLNYSRDVIVWGHSIYLTEQLRIYGEAGWAFYSDVAKPWEFQFGIDYSPADFTGRRGAPFFALNGHLREEVSFGGNFVAQAGWAWRGSPGSGLFRAGVQYFNGKSDQFSFFQESENKIGLAIWYDY